MSLRVWRLVKEKHVHIAFDGEGARLFGGRWNARGTPMVYLSSSLSLAALELFVHLTAEDARLNLAALPVDIPGDLAVGEWAGNELPRDWRSEPAPDTCKLLGSNWAAENRTALLRVPSVIVPDEFNYLLNPAHPNVSRMIIHRAKPFGFDSRMWK